jgi:hypothetical protein
MQAYVQRISLCICLPREETNRKTYRGYRTSAIGTEVGDVSCALYVPHWRPTNRVVKTQQYCIY